MRRFLSLGPSPLANAFLRSPADAEHEQRYPLDVYFCEDCSLVQLADVIDAEALFGEYIYVTGTSDTIAAHNERYADAVVERLRLSPSDLVVEVASNDGSLLAAFQRRGVRTLGVEPARNIAEIARARGIPTENRFFDGAAAVEIRAAHGPARAVIGNNVLAHVDDTRDFLRGCRDLLGEGGLAIFEVPYLGEMIDRLEYDTVYHEHLCYFSVTSLARLGAAEGLDIVHVDRVPVHGGSVRVFFGRRGEHAVGALPMLDEERERGLTTFATYERFARGVRENRRELRALLERLRDEGRTVAGYGAPAKGNTLLNYCRLSTDLIPYTVDKSPLKVGTWTPGMHIPVLPVSTLIERQPDYVVILAWNFADEIMRQQEAYRERGGQFIVPVPSPRVL